MDLKIIRKRWVRGGFNGRSYMRNDHGNMCCLGFLGRACGYSDDDLHGFSDPWDVMISAGRNLFPKGTFYSISGFTGETSESEKLRQTELITRIISVNDSRKFEEKDREAEITRLMRSLDVDVTFEDG